MQLGVYISWKYYQDYLVKNVCVNRNNPKSCCKAKCQLKKQLSKLGESDQKNTSDKDAKIKLVSFEPFTFNTTKFDFSTLKLIAISLMIPAKNSTYSFSYLVNIFHPPSEIA